MTHEKIEALLLVAEQENKRGGFANAEELAREAIRHIAERKIPGSEALHSRSLLALSESFWRRGLANEALTVAEQALALSEAGTGPALKELEAKALGNIGIVYSKLSQNAKALEYYEKSLALKEELGNKPGMAITCGNIGILYKNLSQYAKALEYHEKALVLNEELGNKAAVESNIANIGTVYYRLSQYAKALEYYENALALSEELGNKAGVADDTGNIGNVYFKLAQYAKALEYHEKSLTLKEELGDKGGVADTIGNIGNVYDDLSEHAKALGFFEKALKLSEDIGDRRAVGYRLTDIGSTLRKMGRNKEAMEYLQRSLHLRRVEIESNDDVATTLITIGSLLAEENQIGDALEKLEEGLVLAEKLGETRDVSRGHKELAEIYAKQGDKAKAFDHLQAHYKLKEEIFSEDTQKQVEAFNIRMAVTEKEKEKQLTEMKAQQLEKELSNATLHLLAQTELLSDLRADLLQIARKISPQDAVAREIRDRVKNLPCQSIDWEKFDTQFKAAHPEFVHKLMAAVPDLSPMEIRISTLIRMNLKSEEIARLFCVTERAVEFHRLNIRKKMGLKTKDNLSIVLAKM
ncbi:MAG TPA: tetratricopeptide repeat protein [Candidatus Kapabacteria bacterium]|nr:tetratricopeptide repeat protein [Candidatus Kapabacteria bacterium]